MDPPHTLPDGRIVIRIPLALKRKAGRKEIIPPESPSLSDEAPSTNPLAALVPEMAQEAVVVALARAFRWKNLLESGKFRSITHLAKTFRVDGSYVGRILRLSLLAPDIVEVLIAGKEPDGLSLRTLTAAFPLDWRDQRRHFGFETT